MKRLNRPKGIHFLLVISAVCCWVITGMVFMQDELSALFRLRYDTLAELFELGIIPDGHPAFVQLFLYFWTSIVGTSEWAVKLPSFLCGIGSMVYTYKLGRKFYDVEVGLMATAFVAFSQYFVMYFSLARPYAYGTFFILAQIYALAQWRERGPVKYRWRFLVFSLLAAHTHYFSMLVAGLVALWGFIWLKKSQMKGYLIAIGLAILLFLPHLPISLAQLSKGGIGGPGGWLSAPESDYLWKFICYLGQYHVLGLSIILGSLLLTLIRLPRMNSDQGRFLLLGIGLLLVPFFIGYQYSIRVNPVLQFSVLIFGVIPFIISIFGGWRFFNERVKTAFLITVMCSGIFGLTSVRNHMVIMGNQPLDDLAQTVKLEQDRGRRATVFHNMDPGFMNPIKENRLLEYDYIQLSDQSLQEMKEEFDARSGPVIGSAGLPLELSMMMRDAYNDDFCLVQRPCYELQKLRSSSENDLCVNIVLDSVTTVNLSRSDGAEWGVAFETSLDKLPGFPWLTLNVSQQMWLDEFPEAILVSEIYAGDSLIHWLGRDVQSYGIKQDSTITSYLTLRIQDAVKDELWEQDLSWKVYFWNKGKKAIEGSGLRVRLTEDIPTRYGLFEDF